MRQAWRQYRALLRCDLLLELNSRQMLTSMGIYALLVLVIFGVALSQAGAGFDLSRIGAGLLWCMLLFTSLLGLGRSFAHEEAAGALQGLLLAPLDRSLIWAAKASSNLVFLGVVALITVPLFLFFFLSGGSLPAYAWLAIWPLLVGIIGIAGVGTLLATITLHTKGRDVMLALLFIPLLFPLIYACVAATSVVLAGLPPAASLADAYWPALGLGAAYDAIMLVVAWMLYDFVVAD
jgi:heme exporter protein B